MMVHVTAWTVVPFLILLVFSGPSFKDVAYSTTLLVSKQLSFSVLNGLYGLCGKQEK